MSHKTGKRVLTASTSLALAVVGLAASPIAAHAAASVSLVNVCGAITGSVATANYGGRGYDYLVLPNDGTTYQVLDQGTATPTAVNTATASTAGTSPSSGGIVKSADGASVYYYLPASAYAPADAQGVRNLVSNFAVYDAQNSRLDTQLTNGAITDTTCAVASVPAPTSNATAKTITVTKGEGIVWQVKIAVSAGAAATTTVETNGENYVNHVGGTLPTAKKLANEASGGAVATADLAWNATDGPTATQTLTVAGTPGTDLVTVTARPAPGRTGLTVAKDFKMDTKVMVAYVAPTKQDRDGVESDTVTLKNIPGVTWFYNTASSPTPWSDTAVTDATTAATVNGTWSQVTFQSGEAQATITRPKGNTGTIKVIAQLTDETKYKWDAADTITVATVADQTFVDTIWIKALPAPEMVDADGANDYYVLPKVDGVTWTVTPSVGSQTTYTSNNPLLGTRIPVYTYGQTSAVTYTFAASKEPGYDFDAAVTKKTWSQDYDSRSTITPAAPQFVDKTGIFEDAVTFPALQTGMTGYKIALGTTAPNTASTYVDGSWYGKTVLLTDLQKTLASGAISNVGVYIEAVPNSQLYMLAKDADGNAVKSAWKYTFTNAVNVVPQAPVQDDQPGTANDTLTFPVDPKVTYKTIQNGITRTVPFSDLGKPLPFTGQVTVTVEAATGYQLQPKPDGTAPDPWIFTFSSTTGEPITPQAPQANDHDYLTNDSYSLPAQDGVVWYVDGVETASGTHNSGGKLSLQVTAQPASGYVFATGATTSWTLTLTDGVVAVQEPTVDSTIDDTAEVPTANVTWSSPNASAYKVTYQKLLANGQRGPELTWFADTDKTSANFVANPGDKYYVRVVAMGSDGKESAAKETLIEFNKPTDLTDITTGVGTFSYGWQQLTNLLATQKLPYFGDTAALGYKDASWTVTLPAGTSKFDLYATVHDLGAAGKIQVNGQNWADFTTSAAVWDQVSDPYSYPVRTIQGWDSSKPVTIKVIATDAGTKYLALDAYKAY